MEEKKSKEVFNSPGEGFEKAKQQLGWTAFDEEKIPLSLVFEYMRWITSMDWTLYASGVYDSFTGKLIFKDYQTAWKKFLEHKDKSK